MAISCKSLAVAAVVSLAGYQQYVSAFVPTSLRNQVCHSWYLSPSSASSYIIASSTQMAAEVDAEAGVDVSIPYDSAARLAYDEWRAKYGKGDFDPKRYQSFRENYEAVAVANVVAAREERERSIASGGGAAITTVGKMELNEYADMTLEEYKAAQKGGQSSVMSEALKGASAQEQASDALGAASAALAEEEEKLAQKLGLGSVEELEAAIDAMEGIADDGSQLDSDNLAREARVRSAYMDWCKKYGKRVDEKRFKVFEGNFLAMEKYASEKGKDMILNQYADCTEEEYLAQTGTEVANAEQTAQPPATTQERPKDSIEPPRKLATPPKSDQAEKLSNIFGSFGLPKLSFPSVEKMGESVKKKVKQSLGDETKGGFMGKDELAKTRGTSDENEKEKMKTAEEEEGKAKTQAAAEAAYEAQRKEEEEAIARRAKEMAEAAAAAEKERKARQAAQEKSLAKQQAEAEAAAIALAKKEAKAEAAQAVRRRALDEASANIVREQIKEQAAMEKQERTKQAKPTSTPKVEKQGFSFFKPPLVDEDAAAKAKANAEAAAKAKANAEAAAKAKAKAEAERRAKAEAERRAEAEAERRAKEEAAVLKAKKEEAAALKVKEDEAARTKAQTEPKAKQKADLDEKQKSSLPAFSFFKAPATVEKKPIPDTSQAKPQTVGDKVTMKDPVSDTLRSFFGGPKKSPAEPEASPLEKKDSSGKKEEAFSFSFGKPTSKSVAPTPTKTPTPVPVAKKEPFSFLAAKPKVKSKVAESPTPTPVEKKEPFSLFASKRTAKKIEPEPTPAVKVEPFSFNFGKSVRKPSPAPAPAAPAAPSKKPFAMFGSAQPKKVEPTPTPTPAPQSSPFSFFGKKSQEPSGTKVTSVKKPVAVKKASPVLRGLGTFTIKKSEPAPKRAPGKAVTTKALPTKKSAFGRAAKPKVSVPAKSSIPILSKFVQNPDGSLTGRVRNSKNFRNGTQITTSPVRRGAKPGMIVRTNSGSQYRLE